MLKTGYMIYFEIFFLGGLVVFIHLSKEGLLNIGYAVATPRTPQGLQIRWVSTKKTP